MTPQQAREELQHLADAIAQSGDLRVVVVAPAQEQAVLVAVAHLKANDLPNP